MTFAASLHSTISSFHCLVEPTTYLKASKDPRWVAAMDRELTILHKNHIWIIVDLPPGEKSIVGLQN